MSTVIAFLDTETTSLRPDRRAWEIAVIARDEAVRDKEHTWFIDADHLDLGNADLMSLKIGGFHDRHPQFRDDDGASVLAGVHGTESDGLCQVEGGPRGGPPGRAGAAFPRSLRGLRQVLAFWLTDALVLAGVYAAVRIGSFALGSAGSALIAAAWLWWRHKRPDKARIPVPVPHG